LKSHKDYPPSSSGLQQIVEFQVEAWQFFDWLHRTCNIKGTVSRNRYYFECLNILISTLCLCVRMVCWNSKPWKKILRIEDYVLLALELASSPILLSANTEAMTIFLPFLSACRGLPISESGALHGGEVKSKEAKSAVLFPFQYTESYITYHT
jgi:hypothetical protein